MLQDAFASKDPALVGLIAHLAGSPLQDSIAEIVRRLECRGRMLTHAKVPRSTEQESPYLTSPAAGNKIEPVNSCSPENVDVRAAAHSPTRDTPQDNGFGLLFGRLFVHDAGESALRSSNIKVEVGRRAFMSVGPYAGTPPALAKVNSAVTLPAMRLQSPIREFALVLMSGLIPICSDITAAVSATEASPHSLILNINKSIFEHEAKNEGQLLPDGKSRLIFDRVGSRQSVSIAVDGHRIELMSGDFETRNELSGAACNPAGTKIVIVQNRLPSKSALCIFTIKGEPKGDVVIDDYAFSGAANLRWAGESTLFFQCVTGGTPYRCLDLETLRISGATEGDVNVLKHSTMFFWLVEPGEAPVTGTYVGHKDKILRTFFAREKVRAVDPDLQYVITGSGREQFRIPITVGPEKKWSTKVVGRPEGAIAIPEGKLARIARECESHWQPNASPNSGVKVRIFKPKLNPLTDRAVGADFDRPVAIGVVRSVASDEVEVVLKACYEPVEKGDVLTYFATFSRGKLIDNDEGLIVHTVQ